MAEQGVLKGGFMPSSVKAVVLQTGHLSLIQSWVGKGSAFERRLLIFTPLALQS